MIRRTKIVATIGPATGTDAAIAGVLEAGANVIRINASHGTPELRARWIESVRCAADQAGHGRGRRCALSRLRRVHITRAILTGDAPAHPRAAPS